MKNNSIKINDNINYVSIISFFINRKLTEIIFPYFKETIL